MILTEGNLFRLFFLTNLILRNLKIRKKNPYFAIPKIEKQCLYQNRKSSEERKLQKLTEMGINAFPADEYKITDTTKSIKNDFLLKEKQ